MHELCHPNMYRTLSNCRINSRVFHEEKTRKSVGIVFHLLPSYTSSPIILIVITPHATISVSCIANTYLCSLINTLIQLRWYTTAIFLGYIYCRRAGLVFLQDPILASGHRRSYSLFIIILSSENAIHVKFAANLSNAGLVGQFDISVYQPVIRT